jgi:hypothetical protein
MHPSSCTHRDIAVAMNLGYKGDRDLKFVVWGWMRGVVTCCDEVVRTRRMFVDTEIVNLVMWDSIGGPGLKSLGFGQVRVRWSWGHI